MGARDEKMMVSIFKEMIKCSYRVMGMTDGCSVASVLLCRAVLREQKGGIDYAKGGWGERSF